MTDYPTPHSRHHNCWTRICVNVHCHDHDTTANEHLSQSVFERTSAHTHTHTYAMEQTLSTIVECDDCNWAQNEKRKLNFPRNRLATFGYWFRSHRTPTQWRWPALHHLHCSIYFIFSSFYSLCCGFNQHFIVAVTRCTWRMLSLLILSTAFLPPDTLHYPSSTVFHSLTMCTCSDCAYFSKQIECDLMRACENWSIMISGSGGRRARITYARVRGRGRVRGRVEERERETKSILLSEDETSGIPRMLSVFFNSIC